MYGGAEHGQETAEDTLQSLGLFNKLLEEKHFNNITVQEILDEANVGRSTFYSHFETKDALLKEMCTDIFDHIFSHELHSESSHDFSSSDHGLREKITHLLYHI